MRQFPNKSGSVNRGLNHNIKFFNGLRQVYVCLCNSYPIFYVYLGLRVNDLNGTIHISLCNLEYKLATACLHLKE